MNFWCKRPNCLAYWAKIRNEALLPGTQTPRPKETCLRPWDQVVLVQLARPRRAVLCRAVHLSLARHSPDALRAMPCRAVPYRVKPSRAMGPQEVAPTWPGHSDAPRRHGCSVLQPGSLPCRALPGPFYIPTPNPQCHQNGWQNASRFNQPTQSNLKNHQI